MRRCSIGSKPFVADTTGTDTAPSVASASAKNSDGTAITTTDAADTAAAPSVVASMALGSSTSGRYHGFRRRARMASTTWSLRAHRRTGVPLRAR
jgi:hypothetical protein